MKVKNTVISIIAGQCASQTDHSFGNQSCAVFYTLLFLLCNVTYEWEKRPVHVYIS